MRTPVLPAIDKAGCADRGHGWLMRAHHSVRGIYAASLRAKQAASEFSRDFRLCALKRPEGRAPS